MTFEIEVLYCPTCRRDVLTEAPPCPDGHQDCPDRACLECGAALVLDAGWDELAAPDRASRPGRRGAA